MTVLVCVFQNAALQHLFIRKSFRPFKCLQCGKAFREKDKLDQHLRFHGREGNCPLTCDLCNKGFISSASLESHMKLHSDQKTYSCIFCPESFDRLDLLKDHVAIHINDGCFTCPTCKKRFPDFIQVSVYSWDSRTLFFFGKRNFDVGKTETAYRLPAFSSHPWNNVTVENGISSIKLLSINKRLS